LKKFNKLGENYDIYRCAVAIISICVNIRTNPKKNRVQKRLIQT